MDSSSLSSIESLVNEIKKELVISNQDFNNTFVIQTSAYDTAWLAMIPYNNQEANGPMFESCLNWIRNNQNEQGFWGEPNGENLPTIYALPTTLACMIALKKWNVGESHVRKGLKFIHANTDALLKENSQRFPLWFTIVFPSMLQLAKAQGLDTILVNGSNGLLSDVFMKKKAILESEKFSGLRAGQDQPILTYLESLSHSDNCTVNEAIEVLKHLCEEDGSLFQSPSAIAQAFMATGSTKCLEYLMSIVQKCPNGVPSRFPVDEMLEMLCMVDNIQRMGVALHFEKEIQQILDQVYKNYQTNLQTNEYVSPETSDLPERLFKDSLAFRLLRLQGYKINQGSFCWFLNQPHTMAYMEKNQEQFAYVMYNVYRATDLMFNGESEMEEARSFSRNFLVNNDNISVPPALQKLIEHELNVPWFARLEHLDHRLWIELNQSLRNTIGKSPYYWLSYQQNDKLMQLAVQNYEYRQSIYRKELEDLKRWDAKTLDGPSKIIFEALDDLVCDVAKMYHLQHKIDITPQLRHMWKETFHSWMMESLWSRTSNLPSMDEYLKVGMISIGAHILVLHATSLGCPTVPSENLGPINGHYENITKLLMATTRLLNDIQSYQKEREVGKMNYTLLHLNENPEGHIEDSIDFIKKILGDKKKEFLENVLMDGSNDMPRTMKLLHLSCLNVFHMFYNSCNLFDTQTTILEDIMKAIYIPLQQEQQTPMPPPSKPLPPMLPPQENKIEIAKFNACLNGKNFKQQVGNIGIGISFVGRQAPKNYNSFGWSTKGFASQKLRSCFL
ncbi:(E,E)-geranyllinalool synthase-like isoform X2 [Lycium barbarum]|uniref:(E,E)-geranyllinalool synthase-like isoform X2 n=1 Tax=Lycium barbarum TaxID=112863 RepID=UPI00293F3F2C|nr:(E,E)-geranyllinalool synthase-like isoform X2 [Lycium barbarum]